MIFLTLYSKFSQLLLLAYWHIRCAVYWFWSSNFMIKNDRYSYELICVLLLPTNLLILFLYIAWIDFFRYLSIITIVLLIDEEQVIHFQTRCISSSVDINRTVPFYVLIYRILFSFFIYRYRVIFYCLNKRLVENETHFFSGYKR